MSAFIVSHAHIDALLSFAIKGDKYGPVSYYVGPRSIRVVVTTENATEIGRILLTENERSVYARYPDCRPGGDNIPGTIGDGLDPSVTYQYRPWRVVPSAVSILKACSCFDYQACETGDYEKSLAHLIIQAIRSCAITALPGYDDAPWCFDTRPSLVRKAG